MRARHVLVAARATLLVVGAVGLLATVAAAGTTFDYSLQPHTFRACRLLMPGQSGDVASGTTVPHSLIFEGLRRYPDKPAGWDIENPLAPPAMSTAGNTTKDIPTYWEVSLNGYTSPQLEGFDLIYIYSTAINLQAASYREALMRAVYEGAVLWVDQPYASGTTVTAFAPPGDYVAPNPITTPFTLSTAPQTMGSYRRADDADALLNVPYRLGDSDAIQYLGVYPWNGNANWPAAPALLNASANPAAVGCNDPGFHRVVSVWDPGSSAWLPNVVIYRYGAGAVLVTASDVGYDVVNWWYNGTIDHPLRHQAADCKFAWNVFALASAWTEQRGTTLQRGLSASSAPLPLNVKWQYPDRFETAASNPLGAVVASPVVSGGMVYALSLGRQASGTTPARAPLLMCFDKDPAQDLDHDGQSDDGVVDYALGRSYDMLWSASLDALGGDWTPRGSSPTIATLSGIIGGGVKLQVALVSVVQRVPNGHAVGYVRCYNATFDPRVLAAVPANDTGGNPLPANWRTPGALLWQRTIDSYDGADATANGQVIELTTPTVAEDYVYVLASEVDEDADGTAGVTNQDAYGRAHCFKLNYRWDLDQDGPQWDYPDATTNPNGDSDVAGAGAGDDNATPEPMKLLPPLQNPAWVAGVDDGTCNFNPRPELPPSPTQKPVVDQPALPRNDPYASAYLHFSSPVSWVWNAGRLDISTTSGGTDYMLLPSPRAITAAPYVDLTNDRYWLIDLPAAVTANATDTRITSITRTDDTQIDCSAGTLVQIGTYVYVQLGSGDVRELCLPSRNAGNPGNPLLTSNAIAITIKYETQVGGVWTAAPDRLASLRGPVRKRVVNAVNLARSAARAVENGRGFLAQDVMETDNGSVPAASSGFIQARLQESSGSSDVLKWSFRPAYALPRQATGTPAQAYQLLGKAGLAVDRNTDTVYAAVTSAVSPSATTPDPQAAVPQVLGLDSTPRLEVQLQANGPDAHLALAPSPVVQTIMGGAVITVPATAYTVDDQSRTLTFDVAQAGWVSAAVGPLWGKPLWVTYAYTTPPTHATTTTVTNELHVLPDLVRFQYTPGLVRLEHNVVNADPATLVATLPNGTALTGLTVVTQDHFPAANVPAGANPTWAQGFLAQGLLDVSNLTMPGGEPVRPGSDISISYAYWDPITNAARVSSGERHQVPVNFGESVSSPAVAGATVHVGTEGYHPTRIKDPADGAVVLDNNDRHDEAAVTGPIIAPNGGRRSLLSVLWDPISRVVRGALSQTAYPEPTTYGLAGGTDQGTPVSSSSPAVEGNTVYVGSRMMTQLNRVVSYQGQNLGFVSALAPQRTLICDTARLIEVTGQTPSWICVGSQAPDYHAAYNVTTEGAQELKPTPFSRPAKATYLENGNILVADAGNNRVIEIDRQGRQVWPLDVNGYDYYSSPYNTKLNLERPSDVYRYYVDVNVTAGTRTPTGPHGALNADLVNPATHYIEAHTVVADPGNYRVIDIVTTVNQLGQQTHMVYVLTPDFTRLGTATGLSRIAYTKAQPIFRPDTGGLVGYLCAASNLHQLVVVEAGSKRVNPPANPSPTSGTFNWNWLAWLYDSNLTDANVAPDNPLIFRNIRHVEMTREEDIIYLTITCAQYAGRWQMVQAGTPHVLAAQGAGVFEFAVNVGGAAGTWALDPAVDATTTPATAMPDDPIWRFTGLNYTFSIPATGVRRQLANINYTDADGVARWLPMGWDPVAAKRVPSDLRPTAAGERVQRHLITNHAELIQNLNRANVNSNGAPASLFSSVFVVESDDRVNNDPNDDLHDIDRREVIPDPHELDWPDPFNQPAYAEEG